MSELNLMAVKDFTLNLTLSHRAALLVQIKTICSHQGENVRSRCPSAR